MSATISKLKKVTLDFDEELISQVDVYAKANESDRSKTIRLAVKKYITERQSPVKKTGKKS